LRNSEGAYIVPTMVLFGELPVIARQRLTTDAEDDGK
jgi:hypothetical protein